MALTIDSSSNDYESLDSLVRESGFEDQIGSGVAYQQYAYKGNTKLQYQYEYEYGKTTFDGEDAIWLALKQTPTGGGFETVALGCTVLGDRSYDDVVADFVLHCENAASFGLDTNILMSSLMEVDPGAAERYASDEHLEFGEKPPASSSTQNTGGSTQNGGVPKDEKIVDADGKAIYKVYATGSSIHFTGSYNGSGNFIVEVLDSNQNLYDLTCNEIGDYVLDRNVSVKSGSMYYIQIECNNGTWNLSWTGTGGQ